MGTDPTSNQPPQNVPPPASPATANQIEVTVHEPGLHPVGAGLGAAAGAAITGAVGAIVAGPVGAVVGSIVGAAFGGYDGNAIAEAINPTLAHEYWQKNYASRPYVKPGTPFERYRPAYQYGWEAKARHPGKTFDEVEPELKAGWPALGTLPDEVDWEQAKLAVRDAWDEGGHYTFRPHISGPLPSPVTS